MIFKGMKLAMKFLFSIPILFFIVFAFVKFFSCNQNVFMPKITNITNINVESIEEDSIKITLEANMLNSNFFDLDVEKLNLKLKQNDSILGNAKTLSNFKLISDSICAVPTTISVSTQKMLNNLNNGKDSINLFLVGDVKVKTKIKDINQNVSYPISINLNNLIKDAILQKSDEDFIRIVKAELSDITLSNNKLIITFMVNNPYNISLTLKNYPATVSINGKEAGTGNLQDTLIIKGKSNDIIGYIVFVLDNFKSATSLLSSLLSKKLMYKTEGDLEISVFNKDISVPFTFEGDLLEKR